MSVLCLGEALVDLICERPLSDLADADAFVPAFGGASANVAVTAARHGARVALAGGAGDDAWGRWLRARLEREGVDTRFFTLAEEARTRLAFVAIDTAGEPRYELYGEDPRSLLHAFGRGAEDAVAASDGLFLTTNVLVDPDERELALSLREQALAAGQPVVFDPNLRLPRWRLRSQAQSYANACVRDALLVCATSEEAALMTGETEPEQAARALLKGGARMVVLTLGARGAILRGELRADAPGVPAQVRSTVGAGDTLTGVLLARLALSGWYPAAAAAGLREAVAEASRATERWAALD
ncbi:PfkB family carbohydrate kinase [Conexibacter stalactiti]|uniref:PfkB family carbohydrate kinase n=1 Tax=Conexibacter stalactiti TaxID=1940611 RepID=A0ABU4HME0_9ACTN|nr:PfkB family carbohydrate kinase [Conexibacter stalactiti]MDW5594467.1 PfkB family carbohydrate kinase [Conexibacter stalactiti]MEC5035109.1 PfkB family carbohydrate kinase [Conexibacter stalactiti]